VLKKKNRLERNGLGPLYAGQDAEMQARLQQAAAALEELPDDRPEHIKAKELAFRRHEQTAEYYHKKVLADAWCTSFVIKKYFQEPGREASAHGITQGYLNDLANGQSLPTEIASEVEQLTGQYRFFHWHLAFPEVFAGGAFDCVLGNPPWERLQLEEKQFFSGINETIANATARERKRLIENLASVDPHAYSLYQQAVRESAAQAHLIKVRRNAPPRW
jgi:hypothetical protein